MASLPPEVDLIEQARTAMYDGEGLSKRAAARRARVSEATWRNFATGRNRAEPASLAAMAAVVGITPAQLAAAGRGDAAGALAQLGEQVAAQPEVAQLVAARGGDGVQRLLADILLALAALDTEFADDPSLREQFIDNQRQSAASFVAMLRALRETMNHPQLAAGNG